MEATARPQPQLQPSNGYRPSELVATATESSTLLEIQCAQLNRPVVRARAAAADEFNSSIASNCSRFGKLCEDNIALLAENEKLQAENQLLRKTLEAPYLDVDLLSLHVDLARRQGLELASSPLEIQCAQLNRPVVRAKTPPDALSAISTACDSSSASSLPPWSHATPCGAAYAPDWPSSKSTATPTISPPPSDCAVSATAALRGVKLSGFRTAALNGHFVERHQPEFELNDRETYWSSAGDMFMFRTASSTWAVAKARRFRHVKEGRHHGIAHSPPGFNIMDHTPVSGWQEWDKEAGKWFVRSQAGVKSRGSVRVC